MSKMKVWECTGCSVGRKNPCLVLEIRKAATNIPERCLFNACDDGNTNWHKTTRYEITERKPDYAGMAENKQYGMFKNQDGEILNYGRLTSYLPSMASPFCNFNSRFEAFTPCAEPQPLDPITMEPVK